MKTEKLEKLRGIIKEKNEIPCPHCESLDTYCTELSWCPNDTEGAYGEGSTGIDIYIGYDMECRSCSKEFDISFDVPVKDIAVHIRY